MFSAEQEGETQVLCVHVPDQSKRKEEVLEDSSTAAELVYTLVDQGESVKTLTCESFIRPLSYFHFNFVDYFWAVGGLQQIIFEPGGILCVFERSHNILGLKKASFKLSLGIVVPVQNYSVNQQNHKETNRLLMEHLTLIKGQQYFVFKPGEDPYVNRNNNLIFANRSTHLEQKVAGYVIILHSLDLRINPLKGGGDDATLTSSNVKGRRTSFEPARQLIIAWLNGLFMNHIGLIHEVLDREKLMGLMEIWRPCAQ